MDHVLLYFDIAKVEQNREQKKEKEICWENGGVITMKELDRRTANSAFVGGYCGNGGISRHGGATLQGISFLPPSR